MNLLDVSVAILAGGLGTRLRSVVADRPKALAMVAGRPFLSHLLDRLQQFAIREVVLLVGHRADQIRDTLGESYQGIRLTYSVEESPRGTAGAVRLALPFLKAPQVLLLNGDSFSEVDLEAFLQEHVRRDAEASLVLARVSDPMRFGSIELDGQGRVLRFVEKGEVGPACRAGPLRPGPTRQAGPTQIPGHVAGNGWINAGIYLLQRERIADLPAGRPLSLERDVMPVWVEAGRVYGFRDDGRFLDIGTPESYAAAEAFFARAATGIDPRKPPGIYSSPFSAAKDGGTIRFR